MAELGLNLGCLAPLLCTLISVSHCCYNGASATENEKLTHCNEITRDRLKLHNRKYRLETFIKI